MQQMKRYAPWLALFLIFAGILFSWHYRRPIHRLWNKAESIFADRHRKSAASGQCVCTNNTLRLPMDSYHGQHMPALKKMKHLTFIENKQVRTRLINKGKLVDVTPANGFILRRLSHSSKHLTPHAHKVLLELSSRYVEQVKGTAAEGSAIRLSSLTRTDTQQRRLSNISKAATSRQSAHSYGQAFDIDFIQTKDCQVSRKALEKVLRRMRREGKILLCPERGCIHVTVI